MAEVRQPTRESRFILERESGEELLRRLIVANHAAGDPPLKLVVVVAHPDDEAIGAGGLLRGYRDATVVHITDGGGVDDVNAVQRGFPSREAYTNARRAEVLRALSLVGISAQNVRCLGIRDGEAGRRLPDLTSKLLDVLGELEPDVVLTHPYEGGHTDHDATAFGVHMATGTLRRQQGSAPLVLELTSYHDKDGERLRGEFLPADVPECELVLGDEEREIKRRMFEAFDTQRDVVAPFPVDVERFRVAPRYIFTEPPHPGTLDYERRCMRLTGAEWRALADQALQMLRTRRERRRFPRD